MLLAGVETGGAVKYQVFAIGSHACGRYVEAQWRSTFSSRFMCISMRRQKSQAPLLIDN